MGVLGRSDEHILIVLIGWGSLFFPPPPPKAPCNSLDADISTCPVRYHHLQHPIQHHLEKDREREKKENQNGASYIAGKNTVYVYRDE